MSGFSGRRPLGDENAIVATADGRAVAVSNDKTLKVRNLATRGAAATFTADAGMYCCAVAPDGRTIVAGDAAGRVHFLKLEGG